MMKKTNKIGNFQELLERSMKKYSNRIAFIIKKQEIEKKITYYEFQQDIESMIEILQQKKTKQKKIAILSENRYEWCVCYLASILSGYQVLPFDKGLTKEELENLLVRSEASILFFSEKQEEKVLTAITKIKTKIEFLVSYDPTNHPSLVENYETWLNLGKNKLNYKQEMSFTRKIEEEKESIILYTSGTTGNPKGVLLSQKNICSNIEEIQKRVKVKSKDRFLSILPLHHTYECTLGFLLPISCGATICFSTGYKNFYRELIEYKPTILMGVPLIYEKMLRKLTQAVQDKNAKKIKTKNGRKILGAPLKKLYSGAAVLDETIIKTFKKYHLNLYQVYGLTESSPVISIEGPGKQKIGSVGKILPNLEYKILKPNEKGIGEITVKGPSIMKGYENQDKETKKVLKDGWLLTGDLGQIQKEYLYIVGRKKNVIISKNGENVYPEELELKMSQIPYIKESIIYEEENEICAKIILEKQYRKNKKIEEKAKQAIQEMNQALLSYKRIKKIIISNQELKRTSTNKIKREIKK